MLTSRPITKTLMYEQSRIAVNDRLDAIMQSQTLRAKNIDANYGRLWSTMSQLIQSGGKRLRPILVLAGYEACFGQSRDEILDVAAAWELLHFALLIHDDIIDRDLIRYGSLNVAGQYQEFYKSSADAPHYASGSAILAGDLALSYAHKLVGSSRWSATLQDILDKAVFEVAAGELLDMEAAFNESDPHAYLKTAYLKAASYTFNGPLSTGATMAGATNSMHESLQQYGANLGIAYQLMDDIIGVFGNTEVTGKGVMGDLREGKKTYLYYMTLDRASHDQKQTLLETWGNPDAAENDLDLIKHIMNETGGLQATQNMIDTYANAAYKAIAESGLSEIGQTALIGLIETTTHRAL